MLLKEGGYIMPYTNVTINGLKMPIPEKSTIKDIIEKFFDLRCEFLVSKNSKPIPTCRYQICRVKENDILQIVTYSKYCYKLSKRTIIKKEKKKGKE